MAIRVRITCINTTERYAADERISRVGGTSADGVPWRLDVDDAIAAIEAGTLSFYVQRSASQPVDVIVAVSVTGRKYLKTMADGEHPVNLLLLPECE